MVDTDMTITQKIREAAFDPPRGDITIDYETLFLKKSTIINNDINEPDCQANIRIETYNIYDEVKNTVLYYDFYRKYSNHIVAHILRTLPLDGKSVKYTIYIESLGERNMGKTIRILSDMEIFFNDTQGLTISSLQHKLNQAVNLA